MNTKGYWKVLRYNIDRVHNPKYPLHCIVLIEGEATEHFWMLPEECRYSEAYDWTNAIETDNIWEVSNGSKC